MRIIFSRKGFDAGTGGCPSPIFPDGRLCSLPIPGGRDPQAYQDIQSPHGGKLSEVISDLTKQTIKPHYRAHLDPDLDPQALPRLTGWKPSLGQTGAAQSHLEGQGVQAGDVFVFFGWFRPVEQDSEGHWQFIKGSPSFHGMFGYLQIDHSLLLGENPNAPEWLAQYPWLNGHPHLGSGRASNNTLHLSSDHFKLSGRVLKAPGAGLFSTLHPDLVLTAPGSKAKSLWQVPSWLAPQGSKADLSYHQDLKRWNKDANGQWQLQTVAKGQEFVVDVQSKPDALAWLETLVTTHGPRLNPSKTLRR